jgi:hypothetical protein
VDDDTRTSEPDEQKASPEHGPTAGWAGLIRPGPDRGSSDAVQAKKQLTRRWVITGVVGAAGIAVATWAAGGSLREVWEGGIGTQSPGLSTPSKPVVGTAPTEGPPTVTFSSFFGLALRPVDDGAFGWDRTIVDSGAGPGGGPALRVEYPAHSASRQLAKKGQAAEGGAQAYLVWEAGDCDEAWLAYDVRFPSGFQFVKGGKLPGFFGGTVTSGQHIPDGTNGFSTRYMWRAAGVGEVYAYLPTSDEHGTSLGRGNWGGSGADGRMPSSTSG